MEPDQRTAAAHNLELLDLGLSTKDKKRMEQRLEYKSADLERGLEHAVLVFKVQPPSVLLTTRLLGSFSWYRPGLCQCRFRIATKGLHGAFNRQICFS
jgi:hypothetical protein